jgi:DNA-binding NarL/FixJ family response regulator
MSVEGGGGGATLPNAQSGRERLRAHDPVTVLAVDDQNYFRGVMREVIESTDGFKLVAEATSGEAALEAAGALSPGLVIMDKRMPGMGGVEACRLLTERAPEIVVVITSIEEPDEEAMKSCPGAAFLQKQHLTPRRLRELWLHRRSS